MTPPFPRFLISVLAVAAVVTAPTAYFAATGANLPHYPSTHFPRSQHRRPLLAKMRLTLVASAQFSSRSGSESRPRTAKRPLALVSSAFTLDRSPDSAGLHRVFCPLRC